MGGRLVLMGVGWGSEAPGVKMETRRARLIMKCEHLPFCVNKRYFSNINYNLNQTDLTLIEQINQMLA